MGSAAQHAGGAAAQLCCGTLPSGGCRASTPGAAPFACLHGLLKGNAAILLWIIVWRCHVHKCNAPLALVLRVAQGDSAGRESGYGSCVVVWQQGGCVAASAHAKLGAPRPRAGPRPAASQPGPRPSPQPAQSRTHPPHQHLHFAHAQRAVTVVQHLDGILLLAARRGVRRCCCRQAGGWRGEVWQGGRRRARWRRRQQRQRSMRLADVNQSCDPHCMALPVRAASAAFEHTKTHLLGPPVGASAEGCQQSVEARWTLPFAEPACSRHPPRF